MLPVYQPPRKYDDYTRQYLIQLVMSMENELEILHKEIKNMKDEIKAIKENR